MLLSYKLHIVHCMVEIFKWLLPTQHTWVLLSLQAQDHHARSLEVHPMATCFSQKRISTLLLQDPYLYLCLPSLQSPNPTLLVQGLQNKVGIISVMSISNSWWNWFFFSLNLRIKKCKTWGLHRVLKSYRIIKNTIRHFALWRLTFSTYNSCILC